MNFVAIGARLITVAELSTKKHFWVPAYQRGYRWGEIEVNGLLNDLWGHIQTSNTSPDDYCLQPVVVKACNVPSNPSADDDSEDDYKLQPCPALDPGTQYFELIDGQQRLTTLYLIYRYFAQTSPDTTVNEPGFTISYQTRPDSRDFLAKVGTTVDSRNADYFHISSAYCQIAKWFSVDPERAAAIPLWRSALANRIKVIWFEAKPKDDAVDLFTRLNAGRIALTNAELVKALLLADHGQGESAERLGRAQQWDKVERGLHELAFWHFLTKDKPEDYPTRIDLLLRLVSKTPASATDPYAVFARFQKKFDEETSKVGSADEGQMILWQRVWGRYTLLQEWFADRHIYHRFGWLIASGQKIDHLMTRCAPYRDGAKSAFLDFLDTEIARVLAVDDLENLSYESSDPKFGKVACTRALLLFNVLSLDEVRQGEPRYPFGSHHAEGWSLEHIHAQNDQGLGSVVAWRKWLEDSKRVMDESFPKNAKNKNAKEAEELAQRIENVLSKDALEKKDGGNIFKDLEKRIDSVLNQFSDIEPDDLHSIDNLALLSGDINAKFSNASFPAKRLRLIDCDKSGRFIPPCTRNVFLKYYTRIAEQHLHYWGKVDRQDYLASIQEKLGPYLCQRAPQGDNT